MGLMKNRVRAPTITDIRSVYLEYPVPGTRFEVYSCSLQKLHSTILSGRIMSHIMQYGT